MKTRLRGFFWLLALPLAALALLAGCQHKLIYFPRGYAPATPAGFLAGGGQMIEARTSQGTQVAWLDLPATRPPARLWIVCGGNATLALEMRAVMEEHVGPTDAVLYFDYPGYGRCEGASNPARIRESLQAIIPRAAAACGLDPAKLPGRTMVFGHSLGAAVALIAAGEFSLQRAVLVSPFTSTMEMAPRMTGLPIGFLVTHRFDNRKALSGHFARGGRVWIIHGASDEAIPVDMGRSLSMIAPGQTTWLELPGVGHNDIFDLAPHAIGRAIREAGSLPVAAP